VVDHKKILDKTLVSPGFSVGFSGVSAGDYSSRVFVWQALFWAKCVQADIKMCEEKLAPSRVAQRQLLQVLLVTIVGLHSA